MVPGSVLFADVASHFGSNYPAQLMMGFFTLLACISVATLEATQRTVVSVATPAKVQFACASDADEAYQSSNEITEQSSFAAW
jgi:hypothetical protein